ncbi:CGNR zinc finger domain-containing protein [Nesterenkonia halotolerans]|uniref:CGNR zinc finger domain-containing protein n=1 Tax=Nesterenkonia halotolerans TaxID=225325 RepID=UPI00178934E6|nr:CGNR zinc finger domain-containing protein [Nesterenkonia halotolerans]
MFLVLLHFSTSGRQWSCSRPQRCRPSPRGAGTFLVRAGISDEDDWRTLRYWSRRRCAGENFFEHSRPNARRWRSMARCGNRAIARTHRATDER